MLAHLILGLRVDTLNIAGRSHLLVACVTTLVKVDTYLIGVEVKVVSGVKFVALDLVSCWLATTQIECSGEHVDALVVHRWLSICSIC
jgi:hypothetical protein